jgi:hypothetical protein
MNKYAKIDKDGNVISIISSKIEQTSESIFKLENEIPENNQNCDSFNVFSWSWINKNDLSSYLLSAFSKRGNLLANSDWTQLPDVPEETRLKWQEYRQALRDITLQEGFPENIIWPTKPE